MPLDRRRLLKSLTLAAPLGHTAAAQSPPTTTSALHTVSAFNGSNLPDSRLATLAPVLDRRRAQLQTLRALELPDSLFPTIGALRK